MKALLLVLMMLLSTCSAQKKTSKADSPEESGTFDSVAANGNGTSIMGTPENNKTKNGPQSIDSLTLIAKDPYSGLGTAETLIIKDAKSLQKFYSQINRTRKPGLPVPDIDFSKKMVVVYCSGTTQNGAMPRLSVEKETEEQLHLALEETVPPQKTSAVTTPFALYSMPLTRKTVMIEE